MIIFRFWTDCPTFRKKMRRFYGVCGQQDCRQRGYGSADAGSLGGRHCREWRDLRTQRLAGAVTVAS
jgi:hypothetical protein